MNRWLAVVGGVSMNLALGSLYAWSVFVSPLEAEFGWSRTQTSWVFTIAIVTFAVSTVFAGRIQDVRGPRICAATGATLVGLGFILGSFTTSLAYLYVAFGFVVGLGNGFGLRHAYPGRLEVVSRQARPGRRPHGGRLWWRLGDLRAGSRGADRRGRLAGDVPDPGRHSVRDGNGRRVAAAQPAGRVSAGGVEPRRGAGADAARHPDR